MLGACPERKLAENLHKKKTLQCNMNSIVGKTTGGARTKEKGDVRGFYLRWAKMWMAKLIWVVLVLRLS